MRAACCGSKVESGADNSSQSPLRRASQPAGRLTRGAIAEGALADCLNVVKINRNAMPVEEVLQCPTLHSDAGEPGTRSLTSSCKRMRRTCWCQREASAAV